MTSNKQEVVGRERYPALVFLRFLLAGGTLDVDGYRVRLVCDAAGRRHVCFIARSERNGQDCGEKACGFDLPLEQFLDWADKQPLDRVWEAGAAVALTGLKRERGKGLGI